MIDSHPAQAPTAWRRILAALATLASASSLAFAQPAPSASSPEAGNVYLTGPTVRITEPVEGDAMVAGGRVAIERSVGNDVAVAGGDVAVTADVGEDLRAAGGQVSLDARVGGDAHIVAGRLVIGKDGSVAGRAWLAGGDVQVLGRLAGKTKIYAGRVAIGGEIDGDLSVQADSVELLPAARIRGVLTYASPNPLLSDPAARVDGGVVRQSRGPAPTARQPTTSAGSGTVVWILGLMAAGVVWALLFPAVAQAAQARLAQAPGTSLAAGALVVLLTPVAVVLLLISILGAPLALVLLAVYGLLLLAGYLVVAGYLGDRLLQMATKDAVVTPGRRVTALVVALLLLGLVSQVPLLGWLITLLALMAGSGALVARFQSRWRPSPVAGGSNLRPGQVHEET